MTQSLRQNSLVIHILALAVATIAAMSVKKYLKSDCQINFTCHDVRLLKKNTKANIQQKRQQIRRNKGRGRIFSPLLS